MVAGCGPRWPSPVAVEGRIDAGAFTNSGAGHQDGAVNAGHGAGWAEPAPDLRKPLPDSDGIRSKSLATGSHFAAKIAIRPAPGFPAQTDLHNMRWANHNPSDVDRCKYNQENKGLAPIAVDQLTGKLQKPKG